MKKVFLIFAVVTMTASVFAQEFRLAPTIGLEFSNMLKEDDKVIYSDELDYKSKPGLKIGVAGEYSFNDFFALAPELVFVQRGYKYEYFDEYDGESYSETEKVNINYLQIPINAKVSYPISDDFKIFGFVGPYFGFALSGKNSKEYTYSDDEYNETEKESGKLKFGSGGKDDFKAFDFGLNLGAGAEFKGFFLKAQYNLGLANLATNTANGTKTANRNFGVSIGYMFSF